MATTVHTAVLFLDTTQVGKTFTPKATEPFGPDIQNVVHLFLRITS